MENKKINNRVLKNVRNKIVVSNLEREENMRLNMKKQIMSLCAVLTLVMAGGIVTVNAATDGKLLDTIKETIKVTFVNDDGIKEELEGKTYTDYKGDTWVQYEKDTSAGSFKTEINKNTLDEENLEVEASMKETKDNNGDIESEVNLVIKNK